ncbi:hypothetical protein [Lactobacillus terrae]|uniref:hypothetical protein n=1 Tax=Lactobacillus terrae TaxID=2269374 RepID=UPI000C1B6F2D|nr:hypothetical protein [Lactobacillus terrae]
MDVRLVNNETGDMIDVNLGFSWTTLFFAFFPAIFRKDWKWAGIIFGIYFVANILTLGVAWVGGIITAVVFAFLYNGLYVKNLLQKGYEPAGDNSKKALERKNLIQIKN